MRKVLRVIITFHFQVSDNALRDEDPKQGKVVTVKIECTKPFN